MAIAIDLEAPQTGEQIVEAFLSILPFEHQSRNWRGEPFNSKSKWIGTTYDSYDGIRGAAVHHNWSNGFKFLWFSSEPGWRECLHEASGPAEIRTSKMEKDMLYSSFKLHLGRELHGAFRFQDGWHEHLDYDDVCHAYPFQEIVKQLRDVL